MRVRNVLRNKMEGLFERSFSSGLEKALKVPWSPEYRGL
jgi:hypothetical protein